MGFIILHTKKQKDINSFINECIKHINTQTSQIYVIKKNHGVRLSDFLTIGVCFKECYLYGIKYNKGEVVYIDHDDLKEDVYFKTIKNVKDLKSTLEAVKLNLI